jgi:hypothetical protein
MTIKRMDPKSLRLVDGTKRKMEGVKGAQKLLKEWSNGKTKWINLFRRY